MRFCFRVIEGHKTKLVGAIMLLQWPWHGRRRMDWGKMVQADNYEQREKEECLEVSLTLLEINTKLGLNPAQCLTNFMLKLSCNELYYLYLS